MRRSAAPSQLGNAQKKARFTPPLGQTCTPPTTSKTFTPPMPLVQDQFQTNASPVPKNTKRTFGKRSAATVTPNIEDLLPQRYTNAGERNTGVRCDTKTSDVPLLKFEVDSNDSELDFSQESNGSLVKVECPDAGHHVQGISVQEQENTEPGCSKSTLRPIISTQNDNRINENPRPVNETRNTVDLNSNPNQRKKPSFSKSFKCPTVTKVQLETKSTVSSSDEPTSYYYNVMWCKLSKKKHKKWEGDAILIAKGRSASLMDLEGKEIGRGTGYKTSELSTMQEGHSLCIGGKEIEVMGILSEEDFKSGKCFQSSTSRPVETVTVCRPKAPIKPFVKHTSASSSGKDSDTSQPVVLKPRFDPTAPDALVMPKPSQSHQWQHNSGRAPVVDVVVDPHLSTHLRPHQRHGVDFLYQCVMGMRNYAGNGVILADEMGLGKTLQCISVIWTLLKQGPYGGKPIIKKILVVTPGSLVKNWFREFKKWLGTERLKVYAVTPDTKVEDFVNNPLYPVMVISYEMLVRTIETIRKVKFDLIVCDEGHRLKNTNIKTTSFLMSLSARRRIVLTGTPVQNDLQELFSIVDFCNPDILGSSSSFSRVFEGPILASRQPNAKLETKALGETRAAELNRITSMFILRRTQDINNKYLPPKMEFVYFCKPSQLQVDLYQKLLSSRIIRSCLTSSMDMAQHLMCISALRKLCNHPSLIYANAAKSEEKENKDDTEVQLYDGLHQLYPKNFDVKNIDASHSGKLEVLRQMMKDMHNTTPQQRLVLVSNYTQTLDVLEQLCRHDGYKFVRLDGQTPTTKRQQIVEKFNSKYTDDFVFLLSSKAGGVGLNLVGACRLILYDIDWNPANDLQAMARIWRDGQKHKVYIYRLLTTGSIEEKMYQRQVSKQGLSGVVVDAKTNSKLHFSPDELKDLFCLQEDTMCSSHDLMACTCDGAGELMSPQRKASGGGGEQRQCQIQPPLKKSAKKNICMDELLDWHHVKGPFPPLESVDPVISSDLLSGVSFAFWSESQNNSMQ